MKKGSLLEDLGHRQVKQRLTFSRLDRARDVWVEMMTLLITRLGVHSEGHTGLCQKKSEKAVGGNG